MPDSGLSDQNVIAISNGIDSVSNQLAVNGNTRRARRFARERYDVQRADNLADWNMQNEYNSPTSQMARLREAGLNPMLVYGKGADVTSQSVNSTSTPSPSPGPVSRIDTRASESILTGYDLAMRQAQTDNLKVQNTVLQQEAVLKQAQTRATLANAGLTEQNITNQASLFPYDMSMKRGQIMKLLADTDYTLNQDQRAAAMTSSSLQEASERILNMQMTRANNAQERDRVQQAINGLKLDNSMKQLDLDLKKMGIQPNDALWQRVLGRLLTEIQERYFGSTTTPKKPLPMPDDL